MHAAEQKEESEGMMGCSRRAATEAHDGYFRNARARQRAECFNNGYLQGGVKEVVR